MNHSTTKQVAAEGFLRGVPNTNPASNTSCVQQFRQVAASVKSQGTVDAECVALRFAAKRMSHNELKILRFTGWRQNAADRSLCATRRGVGATRCFECVVRFGTVPPNIPEPRESGFTTTTPVPLYWVRYGEPGRPVLIVLHGGPGADHRYLLPQMLHLAERYDLLLYDQRGGGRSRASDNAPIGWRDHVADLASICAEAGVDSPSLVGYSWGGMLALLYSIAQLEQPAVPPPRRLALISPAPVTSAYRVEFDANLRARGNAPIIASERARLMASDLRARDPDGYRQRIFELGVAGYFHDPARARDLTPFRVVGRVQESTWSSLGEFDLRPDLVRLDVQAHIVHGSDDPIPAASSNDISNALQTSLTLIDRCGHVPYVERPRELWDALDPFLASTDAEAPE